MTHPKQRFISQLPTMTTTTTEHNSMLYDVIIIGGGVVGLSVLRAATCAGYKCVLVEKQPELLQGASGHNSGIACTGVDASPGSLERALIRDGISQMRSFLRNHNVPHCACGSLVCQWKNDDNDGASLEHVLRESHDAGDVHATLLTRQQVHQKEPNLSEKCTGAVHIPGEIVLDPWLYSIALALHARENGATIYTSYNVDPEKCTFNDAAKVWTVSRCTSSDDSILENKIPKILQARAVVNAAGIHADLVQAEVSSSNDDTTTHAIHPHWKARPRRGQYRIFVSTDTTRIHHPIQPVPTQFTKGIFCFSSLYDQIVVGPTALDQESRTNDVMDANVAHDLEKHVVGILPGIQPEKQHVGDYVGIRPGTDHRDYQIRLYSQRNWIVAAGIRSTGLTASLGIGRHVIHLVGMLILPTAGEPLEEIQTTPLPPVRELVEDYHSRGDGKVMIHGEVYRVTHPLTKLGWEAKSGIASERVCK